MVEITSVWEDGEGRKRPNQQKIVIDVMERKNTFLVSL